MLSVWYGETLAPMRNAGSPPLPSQTVGGVRLQPKQETLNELRDR